VRPPGFWLKASFCIQQTRAIADESSTAFDALAQLNILGCATCRRRWRSSRQGARTVFECNCEGAADQVCELIVGTFRLDFGLAKLFDMELRVRTSAVAACLFDSMIFSC